MTSPTPSRRDLLTGRALRDRAEAAQDALAAGLLDEPGDEGPPQAGPTLRLAVRAMATEFGVLLNPGYANQTQPASEALELVGTIEHQLTVYRDDSEISRLNATAADSPQVVAENLFTLLQQCEELTRQTDGAFDATVQPLWRRYADHFAVAEADPAGPDLREVLTLVDWRGVRVAPAEISFDRPGMAVTLNGIAQGYVTDVIAGLLHREGMTRVLVDLGELRALGTHPDGHPWRVGLADRDDSVRRRHRSVRAGRPRAGASEARSRRAACASVGRARGADQGARHLARCGGAASKRRDDGALAHRRRRRG